MSGRRACKRVKHFGLDLTVPRVLSATRKQTRLPPIRNGKSACWKFHRIGAGKRPWRRTMKISSTKLLALNRLGLCPNPS